MSRVDLSTLKQTLVKTTRREVHLDGFKSAAVLLLVVDDHANQRIPLTVRSENLRHHNGQISLPGGKVDHGETISQAALRELEEEIGIPQSDPTVLGVSHDVPTPVGYTITPVIARSVSSPRYVINPDEVAEVFEFPISALAEQYDSAATGERTYKGVTYTLYEYQYEKHRIWGATARILHDFWTAARQSN